MILKPKTDIPNVSLLEQPHGPSTVQPIDKEGQAEYQRARFKTSISGFAYKLPRVQKWFKAAAGTSVS